MDKWSGLIILLLSLSLCPSVRGGTQKKDGTYRFDSPELQIRLTPRTSQQMAAFYEARGFSRPMLDRIREYCFITVYVKNKSQDIIWLDLKQWQFNHNNTPLQRIDRYRFKQFWLDMAIPLAHQSTFRWTLLPEQLDFRPNEREGGNIALSRVNGPITLQARFDTLANRAGQSINIKLDNIICRAQTK